MAFSHPTSSSFKNQKGRQIKCEPIRDEKPSEKFNELVIKLLGDGRSVHKQQFGKKVVLILFLYCTSQTRSCVLEIH